MFFRGELSPSPRTPVLYSGLLSTTASALPIKQGPLPRHSMKLESILEYLDGYLGVTAHPGYPNALNGLAA